VVGTTDGVNLQLGYVGNSGTIQWSSPGTTTTSCQLNFTAIFGANSRITRLSSVFEYIKIKGLKVEYRCSINQNSGSATNTPFGNSNIQNVYLFPSYDGIDPASKNTVVTGTPNIELASLKDTMKISAYDTYSAKYYRWPKVFLPGGVGQWQSTANMQANILGSLYLTDTFLNTKNTGTTITNFVVGELNLQFYLSYMTDI
jgi:hypothetical protein